MKYVKPLLDFIKLPVPQKVAFCRFVIICLTDNPLYPNPDVSLAEAQIAVDNLEAASIQSLDGGRSIVSAMHDQILITNKVFRKLVAYVDRMADGDEVKVIASGFNPSKEPKAKYKAPFAVHLGAHKGSVKLVARAVARAAAYIWQYLSFNSLTNAPEWVIIGYSTTASFEFKGLTIGTEYSFRFATITPESTSDFSSAVSIIVT